MQFNDRTVDLIEEGFDVALRIAQMPDSSLIARQLAQDHAFGLRGAELSQAQGNAEEPGGPQGPRMPDLYLVHLAL